MDSRKFMIIAKGKICTNRVRSCNKNQITHKYDITFDNGISYSYALSNVIFMSNPSVLQPKDYIVETSDGKQLFGIKQIYEFEGRGVKYWHLVFDNFERDYKKADLRIKVNCLLDKKSANTFNYLKEISELSELQNNDGEVILKKYYEKMGFVPDDTALSVYLNPVIVPKKNNVTKYIFPFGCNQSQYKAVRNALDNQISVIQGPPGTGKNPDHSQYNCKSPYQWTVSYSRF